MRPIGVWLALRNTRRRAFIELSSRAARVEPYKARQEVINQREVPVVVILRGSPPDSSRSG
jgi:hypothetical protein